MAVIFSSLGDKDDFDTVVGSVTDTVDATYLTGVKIRLSTNSPAAAAHVTKNSILGDAGRRVVLGWLTLSSLPAAGRVIAQILDSSGNSVWGLQLSAAGVLFNAPTGATSATGRTLVINSRLLLEVAYTITNTTTFEFRVYVNGVLDSTANAGTLTRTGSNRLQIGRAATWPVNSTMDISGVYVDDVADLSSAAIASQLFFGYPTIGTRFLSDGGDVTSDLSDWSTVPAQATSDTSHPQAGTRGIKLAGTTGVNVALVKNAVLSDAGGRGSCWVYFDGYPTTPAFSTIISARRRDGFTVMAIVVNNAGEIFVQPVTTAFLASGTHVDDGTQTVALNTLTEISWAFTITGPTTYTMAVWVNGVLSSSQTGSYGALETIWTESFVLSNRTTVAGTNFWFDTVLTEPVTALLPRIQHYRRLRAA